MVNGMHGWNRCGALRLGAAPRGAAAPSGDEHRVNQMPFRRRTRARRWRECLANKHLIQLSFCRPGGAGAAFLSNDKKEG